MNSYQTATMAQVSLRLEPNNVGREQCGIFN